MGKDVEPVKQILPEPVVADLRLEVACRRGNHPDIHLDGAGAPEPFELPFLQHPQELRLKLERHLADLVEEDRAAVCDLETADLLRVGPREGPLFAAEELALDEVGRKGGAVHRDHGPVFPDAQLVDGMGRHPLPGAGLPEDEDGGIGGGHLLDAE